MLSIQTIVLLLAASVRAGVVPLSYSATFVSQNYPKEASTKIIEPVPTKVQMYLPQLPVSYVANYNQPINDGTQVIQSVDENSVPNYSYSYVVIAPATGDVKSQTETGSGGAVRGEYSLLQPDGVLRKVAYTADDVTGFNAVVKNIMSPPLPDGFVQDVTVKTPSSQIDLPNVNIIKTDVEANINSEIASLAEPVTDRTPVMQKFIDYMPKEGSYATIVITDGADRKVSNSDDKGDSFNKGIILSYEDIIRCANKLAAMRISQAVVGPNVLEKQSEVKEDKKIDEIDLSVLPVSGQLFRYLPTPFVLCKSSTC